MAQHQEKQPYMEDADEEGNVIDDTKTYISTGTPSVKEEANVSRTRKDGHRLKAAGSGSSSPIASPLHHDSDSNHNSSPSSPRKREARRTKESRDRDKERERDRAREKEKRSSASRDRPRIRSSRTTAPVVQTMPSSSSSRKQQGEHPTRGSPTKHVPSPIITAAATTGRPRAYTSTNPRPPSYYGPSASKPPPANARFYPPPPPPPLGTSFPPPSPYASMPPPSPILYHTPSPFAPLPPAAPDYFTHPLRPIHHPDYRRPSSALGRPYPLAAGMGYPPDYDDDPEDGGGALLRRPSLKTRPTRQEQEDRVRMAPPGVRRPSTTIQTRSPFLPPPTMDKRQSFGSIASADYEDESLIMDDESFYSPSEQGQHYNYRPHPARRPSIDPSLFEQALANNNRRGRRGSMHLGPGRTHSAERDLEDKMRTARSYQEKVDGPVDPLTTDSLHQISKAISQGGGARSATRSRGESGYAPTNRNSIDMTDDMRILVKGTATLTIGDAQMDVKEGAEIRFPTSFGGDRNSRGGSDPGSSYADDRDRDPRRPEEGAGARRSRHERERLGTTTATQHARDRRASSRAGSHSRGQAVPASPYPLEYGGGSLGSHYYHPHHPQTPLAYAPYGSHGYTYPS